MSKIYDALGSLDVCLSLPIQMRAYQGGLKNKYDSEYSAGFSWGTLREA